MRKIYLPLLFIFLFAVSYSQGIINKAFHDNNDEVKDLVKVNGNYFFASRVFTPDPQDSCFINSFNSQGEIRFRLKIYKNEITRINRLRSTLDNKIAFIGCALPCFGLDSSQRTFFIKMDNDGVVEFDNTFANNFEPSLGYHDYLKDFVQYGDSSYFAITDSLLFHFNSEGVILSRKNTGLVMQTEIELGANGNLLIHHAVSISGSVAIVDTSATLIVDYPVNYPLTKMLQKNDYTTYTLDGSIRKRDQNMVVIASSSGSLIVDDKITDFYLFNDTIYACGYNATSYISFIQLLDTSLNLLQVIDNPTKKIRPVNIFSDNRIAIISDCESSISDIDFISFSAFDKNLNYNYTQDIGVTSVSVDSSYIDFTYYSGSGNYVLTQRNYKVRITVKNFGTQTLNSFQVNHLLSYNTNCGELIYKKRFDSVNILPGDSLTFVSEWIHKPTQTPLGSVFPANVNSGSLCFHTTIPNTKNDLNIDNDQFCFSFNISTVGMEDFRSENTLSIYPNPTNGIVSIKSRMQILSIELTDISGRKLLHLGSKESDINLGLYEAGIYFVNVNTSKGVVTRKIIKQ